MWKCEKCGRENEDSIKACAGCNSETGEGSMDKNKSVKRRNLMIGVCLAVGLIAVVLWLIFGFLSRPDDSFATNYKDIIERSPVVTEVGVALEIDGVKISEDVWNYYLMRNARDYASVNAIEMKDIVWDEKGEDGQTVQERVKYDAINDILVNTALTLRADEWNISLTDEDRERITDLDYQKQMYGEGVYEELYLKDEQTFAWVRESLILEDKIRDTVIVDIEKYAGDADLADFADNRSATVKQIEIGKGEDKEGAESAKGQAEEVKARLDKGEAFDEIWLETMGAFYQTKLGVNPTTPYLAMIYKGSIADSHKNMEGAALNLKIGEISGIVETDYSYVIMQRVTGYTELLNMIISESELKINREIVENSRIK